MTNKTNNPYGKEHLAWKIPEINQHERGVLWYAFMIGVALILLTYAIWTANFLFAIIILIITFIVYLNHRDDNEMLDFKITEDGILLGKDFYTYKDIKNFWIIYEPPTVKNLYLKTSGIIKPDISIPLDDNNPLKVRKILLEYLDEDLDKEEEEATDRWNRWLRL